MQYILLGFLVDFSFSAGFSGTLVSVVIWVVADSSALFSLSISAPSTLGGS
jgi:hypothetical protein